MRVYGNDRFDISGLAGVVSGLDVEVAGQPDRVVGLEKPPDNVVVRFGLDP